jgi:hypothetical protein
MFKTPEDRLSEIQLYELVAEELEKGEQSKGLWAKALAEGEGNIEKARGLYIKLRVKMVQDEWEIAGETLEKRAEDEKILAKAREASAIALAQGAREVREFSKKGKSRNVGIIALILWLVLGTSLFLTPVLGMGVVAEGFLTLLVITASTMTARWLYLKHPF